MSLASAPFVWTPRKYQDIASDHSGLGVLIKADDDGFRHPVAYWSRKWTSSELKWPTCDKECRAVLDAICHWSTWVKGRHFNIESDHHSLQHLRSQRNRLPRQERFLDILADFNFDVLYVPGPRNCGVDGLSRLAELNSTVDTSTSTKTAAININSVDESFLSACVAGYKTIKFFRLILERLLAQTTHCIKHVWICENGLLWYHDIIGNAPRLGISTMELQVTLM
jgi:hypothetical protein